LKKARSGLRLQLLIGLVIVLTISTTAISGVLRSYKAAQESSAIDQIHAINAAERLYVSVSGGRFGNILQLITARMLDPRFAYDSGYNFAVATSASSYTVTATPRSTGAGRYGYYSESDAVVRYQTAATAACIPCFPDGKAGNPVQ
jgi:type II secretory pathway pseudopilin PulG